MPPDEDAFIAALVADPADETTRLVYADWLEERGDDARAAFLRAEVVHFRMSEEDRRNDEWGDTTGVDPVWAAMVSRAGVLVPGLTFSDTGPKATRADLKAIEDHWGRPLPPDYAAFLLLHNGGTPSKPYLWSYLDDEELYDEVHLFSTADTHSNGRPRMLTTPAKLLGGRCSDPQEGEVISRMMPIGALKYVYDGGDYKENLLVLDLPNFRLENRIVELENSRKHGLRRAAPVHAKESFTDLLHSLDRGP